MFLSTIILHITEKYDKVHFVCDYGKNGSFDDSLTPFGVENNAIEGGGREGILYILRQQTT